MRLNRPAVLALLVAPLAIASGPTLTPAAPEATHGVASTAVGPNEIVVWSRTNQAAELRVALATDPPRDATAAATAENDYTAQVTFRDLEPGTRYRFEVRFRAVAEAGAETEPDWGPPTEGWAATPPDPDAPAAVTLAWSGDLGGQNVCRDAARDYPALLPLVDLANAGVIDLFVGLGDMIYADNTCAETGRLGNAQVPGEAGPATTLAELWAHWRYNHASPNLAALLARVPYVAVWDDHETVNDVGPAHDAPPAPGPPDLDLLPLGLQAFLDYGPMPEDAVVSGQLYRRLRWGGHLDVFLLDTRQYRDPNSAPDTGDEPKTLLGASQREWLLAGLAASDATWRVVVCSVPIAIPTGAWPVEAGRDGWAGYDQDTGFERELMAIFEGMREAGVMRTVWITTDVHFAAAFRHRPFAATPDFEVTEIAVGPLSAGLFPNRALDDSFGTERLFFHGPDDPAALASLDEALPWMSYGLLAVDADGGLEIAVRNGLGELVWRERLAPR